MTTLPNWVDLIIVTIVLRGGYSGFGRGFLAELLALAGAVITTVVAINYWNPLATWLSPWLAMNPRLGGFMVFVLLFLTVLITVRVATVRITAFLQWERLHWAIQGMGMLLGGLRGLWWSAVFVVFCVASGFTYLQVSVESQAVLGPGVLRLANEHIRRVSDLVPGSHLRVPTLIPPVR